MQNVHVSVSERQQCWQLRLRSVRVFSLTDNVLCSDAALNVGPLNKPVTESENESFWWMGQNEPTLPNER